MGSQMPGFSLLSVKGVKSRDWSGRVAGSPDAWDLKQKGAGKWVGESWQGREPSRLGSQPGRENLGVRRYKGMDAWTPGFSTSKEGEFGGSEP